jgi:hypothetical protein
MLNRTTGILPVSPIPSNRPKGRRGDRPARFPRIDLRNLRHPRHLCSTPSGGAFNLFGVLLGSLRRCLGGALGALPASIRRRFAAHLFTHQFFNSRKDE